MIILIMGLSGAGKTTLAKQLVEKLAPDSQWINADEVRSAYNDWDFSKEGRIRQANRMKNLAHSSDKKYVIVDFICPTEETRKLFNADFVIWMNTTVACKYTDTNMMFQTPTKVDIQLTSFDYKIDTIIKHINI